MPTQRIQFKAWLSVQPSILASWGASQFNILGDLAAKVA